MYANTPALHSSVQSVRLTIRKYSTIYLHCWPLCSLAFTRTSENQSQKVKERHETHTHAHTESERERERENFATGRVKSDPNWKKDFFLERQPLEPKSQKHSSCSVSPFVKVFPKERESPECCTSTDTSQKWLMLQRG